MAALTVDGLTAAVRRHFGSAATIENVVLPTLGGSNLTTIFDVVEGAGAANRRRLVSRQETYVADNTPFLAPDIQFRLLQVATKHGIPCPAPVFELTPEDGLGRGYVTAFVGGETFPKRILTDARFAKARERLASQSGEVLARLHAIPVEEVAFLAEVADSRDPLGAQLARLDSYGEAHPAVELGARWLIAHRPKTAARKARQLVHGDYRTGNLLVSESGLEALLDWECAHLGSGLEDLGWLCTRSWRFGQNELPVGGFGSREQLFAAYSRVSGAPFREADEAEVHWWEVFGLLRWVVLNVMQAYGHHAEGRRSAAFAACGRNASLYEYELLMTLAGRFT
jgi:aminoglycoside phosphotransferase (APT) family kinase protein